MFTRFSTRFHRSIRLLKWLILAAIILIPIAGFTGIQLENNDAFCASCHTEPETEYVARTLAGTALDLASYHHGEGSRCIDCHSGEGANGRIQAMTLGAEDLLHFISGNFSQPAPLTRPINDENCLKCHTDLFKNRDFDNHYHNFLKNWQFRSDNAGTCAECHQSHTINGNKQNAFVILDAATPVCERCHNLNRGIG